MEELVPALILDAIAIIIVAGLVMSLAQRHLHMDMKVMEVVTQHVLPDTLIVVVV